MRIIDEDFLDTIRLQPCCWCGRKGPSEAAHVFSRGPRSCYRLDIPENSLPLCRQHHAENHSGQITLNDMLALAASRCNCLQKDIVDLIYALRREPQKAVDASDESELYERWKARVKAENQRS